MRELKILLFLGKRGALKNKISITTTELANELKIPQQTVSRILIKLIKRGLITGERGIGGYEINITPKGKELLHDLDITLDEIFRKTKEIIISGKVIDGLKDGRYYLSQKEYRKNILEKLGFELYPGTLNIKLDDQNIKEKLQKMEGVEIKGFKMNDRIFGSIKCFKSKIDGVDASVIIPERSHYGSDILEIISPFELRKKLKLKNGDEVVINVT